MVSVKRGRKPVESGSELTDWLVDPMAEDVLKDLFEKVLPLDSRKRQKELNKLASGYALILKRSTKRTEVTYDDGTSVEVYNTALPAISRLYKKVNSLITEDEYARQEYNALKTLSTKFKSALAQCFNTDYQVRNELYKRRVDKRSSKGSEIFLDLTPWIEKAGKILSDLDLFINGDENINEPDWRDVSVAVALCTGRRQSEIHWSGVFTYDPSKHDEYHLDFSGQLKGKSRKEKEEVKSLTQAKVKEEDLKDHVFTIETVCKARLIPIAINWLEIKGKRADKNDTEGVTIVNRRWGKYLSERIKKENQWYIVSDDLFRQVDPMDVHGMTYHKTRALYLILIVNQNKGYLDTLNLKDKNRFYERTLGDANITAISSYLRFELEEGSKTRV